MKKTKKIKLSENFKILNPIDELKTYENNYNAVFSNNTFLKINSNFSTYFFYRDLCDKLLKNIDINKLPMNCLYYKRYFDEKEDINSAKVGVSIMYFTDYLNDKLELLFGDPCNHEKFGVGINNSNYLFSSYFISINNIKFHIGYDNNGMVIEVSKNTDKNDVIDCLMQFPIEIKKNKL